MADETIIAAWESRKAAYAAFNAADTETAEDEKPYWDIIDGAEEIIRSAVATTPEGVAIQLWTALEAEMTDTRGEDMLLRRDLDRMAEQDEDLDWSVRLILAALRSLQAMGA